MTSEELLEEMLLKGEQEFYPKLRRSMEKFVDIFNHDDVQNYVIQHFRDLDQKLCLIRESKSVYDILRSFKRLILYMTRDSAPVKLFKQLQVSGFFALLTDNRFNFLGEDISISEGSRKLVNLMTEVEEETLGGGESAFEEYVKGWVVNHQAYGEIYIKREVKLMRQQRKMSEELANAKIEGIINDITQHFEPLRRRLVPLQVVQGYIKSYILDLQTDTELKDYLEAAQLEDYYEEFREIAKRWLSTFHSTIPNSLRISKAVALAEVDRLKMFTQALVLNKPDLVRQHRELTENLIKAAANIPNTRLNGFLPFVSFGQMPLPTAGSRTISLTFVHSEETTSAGRISLRRISDEIKSLLNGFNERFENRNNVTLLHIDVELDENLPQLVARNLAKLSELSITAILVGSFGLGGFMHTMRPEFNRIYGEERAQGFISTESWGRSLVYGGEPYFCPTGWRRFAINVGKSPKEFQRDYGDWPVAYHGTTGHLSTSILEYGLKANGGGCYLDDSKGAVYLSPSVEYSGHPRYAKIWKIRGKFIQMVLQLRVSNKLIFSKHPGTLNGAGRNDPPMDCNYADNKELEWVIRRPPGTLLHAVNGIIVYGLMLRVTDQNPRNLPQCSWWGPQYTADSDSQCPGI